MVFIAGTRELSFVRLAVRDTAVSSFSCSQHMRHLGSGIILLEVYGGGSSLLCCGVFVYVCVCVCDSICGESCV